MKRFYPLLFFITIIFIARNSCVGQAVYDNTASLPGIKSDSTISQKMLAFALNYANSNKGKDSFQYDSQKEKYDSGLSIEYGHLFDSHYKHLIVQITAIDTDLYGNELIVDVFVMHGNQFVLLCSDTCNPLEFTGYSIFDVNGDGYKDYVFGMYGMNGCCARQDEHVYLYKKDSGTFAPAIETFNPDYYPQEKMVLQMSYGWPGFVTVSKSIWNGFKLNEVETLALDTTHEDTYFIKNEKTDKMKTVKGLPAEYKKYKEINWFLDKLDEGEDSDK